MPIPTEDTVVVAPPTGGNKNIRNLQITTLVNGLPTVVDMQVISIAALDGTILDEFTNYRWQQAILDEMKKMNELLGLIFGAYVQRGESAESFQR